MPEAKAEFDKQMDQLLECYNKIADILTNTHEKAFLEQGMSEKDALNKAKKKPMRTQDLFFQTLVKQR